MVIDNDIKKAFPDHVIPPLISEVECGHTLFYRVLSKEDVINKYNGSHEVSLE